MNAEELNRLLEKYYNGETTVEEEVALKEYFTGNDIPEGYETEKMIFGYYSGTVLIPEPAHGFEARILEGIDKAHRKSRNEAVRKSFFPYLSAAAGLLILFGSYFFFIHRNEPIDTFSNPEIAYSETVKILFDVSAKLNQGTRTLKPVGKITEMTSKSFDAINKSKLLVDKNLNNIRYLQKAIEISDVQHLTNK